jgi:hypothetical protein
LKFKSLILSTVYQKPVGSTKVWEVQKSIAIEDGGGLDSLKGPAVVH